MRSSVGRLEEAYADRIDFHVLNIDHLSTRDLARKYGVEAIPNIVLLDGVGTLVEQLVGFQSEEALTAALERLLAVDD